MLTIQRRSTQYLINFWTERWRKLGRRPKAEALVRICGEVRVWVWVRARARARARVRVRG